MSLVPGFRFLVDHGMPMEPFTTYRHALLGMRHFQRRILKHLRALKASDTLLPTSFGHALLELAELPGITETDLCAEINLIFIAGEL